MRKRTASFLLWLRPLPLVVVVGVLCQAQGPPTEKDIDATVWNEIRLIEREQNFNIEIFLENRDAKSIVQGNAYWVGRVHIDKGVPYVTEFPSSSAKSSAPLTSRIVPAGFVSMILPDLAGPDQDYYDWKYGGEQISGGSRCWVFDLKPKEAKAYGAFVGRVLVAETDQMIIRYDGTFMSNPKKHSPYLHFISVRAKSGVDGQWVPWNVYINEKDPVRPIKGGSELRVRITAWGFQRQIHSEQAVAELQTEGPIKGSQERSTDVRDPHELDRAVEQMVVAWMTAEGLLARPGQTEADLNGVAAELVRKNNEVCPEIQVRLLLTTPLEDFTIGCTVVISKEVLNVASDDAVVSLLLAPLLAHILLSHPIKPVYADLLQSDGREVLRKLSLARTNDDIEDDDRKALELLVNSQSPANLARMGSFLRPAEEHCRHMPALFLQPRVGNAIPACDPRRPIMQLIRLAPRIAIGAPAFSLGSRSVLDPVTDTVQLLNPSLEQEPFQLIPLDVNPRQFVETPSPDPILPPEPLPRRPAVPPLKW
jgi:hypothetical protein